MSRQDDIEQAAARITATASAMSSQARRAARAATSEAARAVRDQRETVRNVFHDLADEAEARARTAERKGSAIAGALVERGMERPIVAVALIAATAALASALGAAAFTRR
jgi:hypothetical protein